MAEAAVKVIGFEDPAPQLHCLPGLKSIRVTEPFFTLAEKLTFTMARRGNAKRERYSVIIAWWTDGGRRWMFL